MKPFFTSICCAVILLHSLVPIQAQQLNWLKGGGSTGGPVAYQDNTVEATLFMCTDANGNVYAVSRINNATAHAETFSGITYGSYHNVLITSYNCSGQMRWAKLITSSGGNCEAYGIVADKAGHIYVAGTFFNFVLHIGYDTAITGIVNQTQALIQLDTVGHFNWIRYIGDNTTSTLAGAGSSGAVVIDTSNHVHFFNYMRYGVHLSPSLTSHYGTYDLAYDPGGVLLNIKRVLLDSTLMFYGITIDKQSNKLYGYGYRVISFWTGGGGDSSYHAYISEFDTARNLVWMDTLGCPSAFSGGQGFTGIAADGLGSIYISGGSLVNILYRGYTIDTPHGAAGRYMAFIMKTDTAGNMKWVKQTDGNINMGYWGMTLVGANRVAAAGYFARNVNSGTLAISSPLNNSPFLTVLDTSGTLEALQRIHGNGPWDFARSITADKIGNIYIGGSVSDTLPDTLVTSYHSIGGVTDFFVLKYGVDCSCASMPVAAYTYTLTGLGTVNATYTGTTAGLDSVVWSFGDGTTAHGLTASHTYTVFGAVYLCVTVYTSCGYDIKCDSITVNCPGAPVSSFTWSGSLPVSFNYTGTTLALDSVVWSYGDGGRGTGTTPSHTFAASGTYTVCATAYTACGSNTACNVITVNCTPVSSFTHSGIVPTSFTYTGSTAGLTSVTWDFGDGGTATGSSPSHSYTAIGTYTVCATVHTSCGSDDSCSEITIPCISAPAASFTDTGTHTYGFVYTGTTTAIDSVVWDFGDGIIGHGLNPFHTYDTAGTYHVCVTAYNPCGSDSVCHEVIMPPLGISSVALANIKVYPNPAMDELIVSGMRSTTTYRLLSITGSCLLHGILYAGANTISIKDYAPGIYMLEMTVADGTKIITRVMKE